MGDMLRDPICFKTLVFTEFLRLYIRTEILRLFNYNSNIRSVKKKEKGQKLSYLRFIKSYRMFRVVINYRRRETRSKV